MSTTKVPPPRKLTEKEDLDSFEDFWFQIETYYGRDPHFAPFINDPSLRWRSKNVLHRGLGDETAATNLNTFLRALATYALGPYIKQNILENTRSLHEVKREFMKLLEIDLSDNTFMNFYDVKRRVNERPLMFYHRIRYHAERHLLREGDRVGGVALQEDEKLSPSLERVIILEWLRRIDERLVKFVQEKFATELNYGNSALLSLVDTLAKNMDTYISGLNRGASAQGVNYSAEPPVPQVEQPLYVNYADYDHNTQGQYQVGEVDYAGFRGGSRGGSFGGNFQPRGQFQSRGGFTPRYQQPRPQPQFRPRGGFSQGQGGGFSRQSGPVCEYCYLQVQTRRSPSLDYHHLISSCDRVSQMQNKSRVGYMEDGEEQHEYSQFVEDYSQFGQPDSQQQE